MQGLLGMSRDINSHEAKTPASPLTKLNPHPKWEVLRPVFRAEIGVLALAGLPLENDLAVNKGHHSTALEKTSVEW